MIDCYGDIVSFRLDVVNNFIVIVCVEIISVFLY